MFEESVRAHDSQDILRSLILLIRHFQDEKGEVRLPQEKIVDYISEFGESSFSIVSKVDFQTKDVVLTLDRVEAPRATPEIDE